MYVPLSVCSYIAQRIKDLQGEKEFQVEMGDWDGIGSQGIEVPLDQLVMQVMMEVTVSQVEMAVMDSQGEMV